jgi:hypothetical protein
MQKAPLQEEPLVNGRWTAPWHRWLDSISLAFNSLGRQFIDLEDVEPNSYTGQAGKVVKVKATEDGLEFGIASGGVSDHNDLTGLQGGATDEYYHLSNADYTEAVAFLNGGSTTHTGLDGHIADTSIHFTQANIDHTVILNKGTNTHAQIDTAISNSTSHIADTSIHYAQSAIDHTVILNRGTNTHAQIDTHIANTSNPHSVTANQVLPSQSGNSGKFLTTDGSNTSWDAVASGTAFDEVLTTYTSGNITTEVFKLAGSTVKTVTRTYDSSNRPATISDGTNTWTFEYNSTGLQTRRVKT